jgi:hypothetical protein
MVKFRLRTIFQIKSMKDYELFSNYELIKITNKFKLWSFLKINLLWIYEIFLLSFEHFAMLWTFFKIWNMNNFNLWIFFKTMNIFQTMNNFQTINIFLTMYNFKLWTFLLRTIFKVWTFSQNKSIMIYEHFFKLWIFS